MLRDALYTRMESAAPKAHQFLGARCDRIVASVLGQLAALSPTGGKASS
jgi:hypothetical protein